LSPSCTPDGKNIQRLKRMIGRKQLAVSFSRPLMLMAELRSF
jgi:hypothetical protein